MDIPSECIGAGGFVVNQAAMGEFKFGTKTVGQSGCGYIAVYNALKAAGLSPAAGSLLDYFNGTMFLGGILGAAWYQIFGALMLYDVSPKVILRKDDFSSCNVGIMNYKTTSGAWHYVAFVRCGGRYTFPNAITGKICPTLTMDEFLKKYVKSKIVVVLKVK